MTPSTRGMQTLTHPAWCVPDRCGHIVPPLMAHMARRHRGPVERIGDLRGGGFVASYLIGDEESPVVALHVASRTSGKGWAELSLVEVARLATRLDTLLRQVSFLRTEDR